MSSDAKKADKAGLLADVPQHFVRGFAWAGGVAAFSGVLFLVGAAFRHRAERKAARYEQLDDDDMDAEFARRELRRRELAGED